MSDIKLFFKYITPSMTGMLIAGTYSIVDTFFIGKALGENGLASAALTWPLVMLPGAFGDMIGTGSSIIISQERGAGNQDVAERALGNLFTLEIVGGLLFPLLLLPFLSFFLTLLGATPELLHGAGFYAMILIAGAVVQMISMGAIAAIRNDDRPVLAMWLISTGLLMNIFLDWLFVIVIPWGLAGAAAATVIAQIITAFLGIAYFFSRKSSMKLRFRLMKPHWRNIGRSLKNGIPTLGVQLSIIGMLLLHNWQSLRYGAVPGLAAYTVIAAIESMGSLLMTGLAAGLQPLACYFHGAHKYKRNLRIAGYGLYTSFAFGIVLMAVSIVGHSMFPDIFGLSGRVAEIAGRGLVISAPAFLLLGVIRVGSCYFQSTEKLTAASVLIYGDTCFVLPLCLFLLPLCFGLDGVWAAMPVSRIILFAILLRYWYLYYMTSKTGKDSQICLSKERNNA